VILFEGRDAVGKGGTISIFSAMSNICPQQAKFSCTNIPEAPGFAAEANDKKRARLNCVSHILSKVPYSDMTLEAMKLSPRRTAPEDYVRPPRSEQFFVPSVY